MFAKQQKRKRSDIYYLPVKIDAVREAPKPEAMREAPEPEEKQKEMKIDAAK